MKKIILFTLILCGFYSCSYAPPPRTAFGMMSESVGKGNGVILAGAGIFALADASGEAELRGLFGLSDKVDLDVGLSSAGFNSTQNFLLMGGAGVHYHLVNNSEKGWRVSLTGGIAVGCGGTDDNGPDGCSEHFAIGAYPGIEFGYRFSRLFSIYEGNRYMVSYATSIPVTHWGQNSLGLQFDWTQNFFTTLEGGVAYYKNTSDSGMLSNVHLGLGIRFGKK